MLLRLVLPCMDAHVLSMGTRLPDAPVLFVPALFCKNKLQCNCAMPSQGVVQALKLRYKCCCNQRQELPPKVQLAILQGWLQDAPNATVQLQGVVGSYPGPHMPNMNDA